ncbi:hypothetical protein AC1031_002979 [Aphanomyces cochlioides]|nr:hypothetical protein AC1031_002979 [Aphanomyces cochlioides]
MMTPIPKSEKRVAVSKTRQTMQRRQVSYRKPRKGMARSMTSAHVTPASSPSTKSPPKCLAKTGSIAAATLAHALERSDASAAPAVDSNTFAASYWKQQVIATKRKLAAVVDRHTRDVIVVKQRLHRPMDNDETASLPHCSALDDARDATLRAIVSKPAAEPPPARFPSLSCRHVHRRFPSTRSWAASKSLLR